METNFRQLGIEVSNAYIKTLEHPRIINCDSAFDLELKEWAHSASILFCNFVKREFSEYLDLIINEDNNYVAFQDFVNGIVNNINKMPYIAHHEEIGLDFFVNRLYEILYNNYIFPKVNGTLTKWKEKQNDEIEEGKIGWVFLLPIIIVWGFLTFWFVQVCPE